MAHQRPTSGKSNPATVAASAMLLVVVSLGSLAALAEEPGHPKAGYPAVEDVPPRPAKPAMTADEQVKLKKELSAKRDHQTPKAVPGLGAGPPVKP
jgi:hypothetical protein